MKPHITKIDLELPEGIISHLDSICEFERSGVVADDGSFESNADMRQSNVSFFPDDDWVAQWCYKQVMQVNADIFQLDLYGYDNNCVQYSTYDEGDFYTWHIDTLDREIDRKLSFSLILNDEFIGGEFQFGKYHFSTEHGLLTDAIMVPTVKGSLIVFTSETPHRVLPVKKGIRKSIVGWIVGPPLK